MHLWLTYRRAITSATLACGLLSFPALADKLRITTVPPGATVQITAAGRCLIPAAKLGINSQKLVKRNVTGIGFALSASDLLEVLHRFYPAGSKLNENIAASANAKLPAGSSMMNTAALPQISPGLGVTEITSDPDGAEIFLDDKFIGTTPATLHLTEGAHTLILKSEGHANWIRSINILKESTVTVKAALRPI